MRRSPVLLIFAVVALGAFAQQTNTTTVNRNVAGPGRTAGEKKPEPVVTSAERKRGLQMMADTETAIRGMAPATQALALAQMAKAYGSSNKKKSIALLNDALAQIRDAQFDFANEDMKNRIRGQIQQKILSALLPLDPGGVEQMLDQVDPRTRQVVLNQLLIYYEEGKQDEKALDILEQITRDEEMPFGVAATLMARMTPDQNAELRRLFTDALGSFDLHDDGRKAFSNGFASLITKFHNQLPPELSRQAIDTVLAKAKKADEPRDDGSGGKPRISVASAKGAAQFSSHYEFALFELLPTLEELDPEYAERLLKENSEAKAFLVKFPGGLSALTQADNGEQDPTMSMTYSNGAPPSGGQGAGQGAGQGGPGGPGLPSTLDMQRIARIDADAAAHPAEAMAQVPLISDADAQANAYVSIAHAAMKKDSATAHSALKKAMELAPTLRPDQQVQTANSVAAVYQRMGDMESARATLEKSVDLAASVYKEDTNADDPNQAPKWYWPSTAAWRSAMIVATKLDATWAQGLLKAIPDDEIRALNQLAIASELLKIPMNRVEIMSVTKRGARMMMMDSRDDQ